MLSGAPAATSSCRAVRQPDDKVQPMDAHGLTVRPAAAEDAEQMVPLLEELGYPNDPHVVRERLAKVPRDDSQVLVAEDEDGRLIGLATMQVKWALHRPADARLGSLVVASRVRGRGVGRLLLDAVERWAADHGCTRVELTSGSQRTDAHAFYEHCGYHSESRRFVKPVSSSTAP
jgi:GNAT superfamily N-acetyltransferase